METLLLVRPALSAALLVVFIDYVLEDRTYVLGSNVRNVAIIARVER